MQWDLIFSNALYAAIAVNAIGYCLIAVGLNVHFGYTGLLNFGQAGFAAIGAYAVAVPIARYGWSLWAAIPIIFVGGIVLGLILGVPTLRLRADYLAIVTIAAAEIIRLVLGSERFRWLFGGQDGLQGYTQQLQDLNPFGDDRITVWAQNFGGYDLFIIVVGWIIVALTSLLVWSLMRSPWGRVLKSIREDEDAARSLGKNVFSYKMQSLVVGGIIGALGGTVIAVGNRAAQPGNYSTTLTFFSFTILILGGVARVKGPIVGAMIFWFTITIVDNVLAEAVRADAIPSWLGWLNITNANFGQVKYMIAGAALALLVIFRPQGIFGDRREQAFDVR
ncbi:MAG: branched-chain amino acid ABC transporter permease [Ilumatobacteraceae bacterium]